MKNEVDKNQSATTTTQLPDSSKETYSKEEVQQLISQEVDKAVKKKGYSYSKWATDNFIAGIFGIILIIIIVSVLAALGL